MRPHRQQRERRLPPALKAKTRVGFRPCRNSASKTAEIAENLLQQEFSPTAVGRCWAGDITDIRTTGGWRYLAVWIDLYSRRVVGWAMGATMQATLLLEALNRALGHRQIEPDQLLIHSDQGEPVPGNGVPAASGRPQDQLQHVGQRLLRGQRRGGELLLHPQTRTGPR
ncbi:MAG: DDE-type integrase/transposase/recombinase [Cyanobacteriota bacterium]